jgi:proline iminopeptidase
MTLLRALAAWFFLFLVAFANGAFRELYYAKYLGALRAHQISCGIGLVLIIAAVWTISRRWHFQSLTQAWRAGWLWLALTVAWEFVFGHFVMGHPWEQLLNDYAFWRGRLWLFVLAGIFMSPVLVYRVERRRAITAAIWWALAGWAACGLTMAVCRAIWGLQAALWLHGAAAPVIFFVVTIFYWNRAGHLRPIPMAGVFLAAVLAMDLLVVAPFFEKSFAMFTSVAGTWIPFGLIFLGSLATGMILSVAPQRRPFLKWMPGERELMERLPEDAHLDTERGSTHAIGIAAEPARIWPWLIQMGYGRGGWYSYDRLDNWGHRSAEKIRPEFQNVKAGDRLPSTPDGKCWFEVLEAEPGRHFVLASHLTVRPLRSLPWGEPSPKVYSKSTWTFALEQDGEETRLLVRARSVASPWWRWIAMDAFFSLAHVIMQRKQLLNLKRLAEQ